jgi:hypothetical protein
MLIEAAGISSIGSTPLWGSGGTTAGTGVASTSAAGGEASSAASGNFLNMIAEAQSQAAAQSAASQAYNSAAMAYNEAVADGLWAWAETVGLNPSTVEVGTLLAETALYMTQEMYPLW